MPYFKFFSEASAIYELASLLPVFPDDIMDAFSRLHDYPVGQGYPGIMRNHGHLVSASSSYSIFRYFSYTSKEPEGPDFKVIQYLSFFILIKYAMLSSLEIS